MNMNIYRFINSRDIRKHLEDIGYEFNALEASWLVYQCADATLEEKHDAWRWITENMPDMEVIKRPNCVYRKSLHETLRKYMEMEEKLLDLYIEQADAVYVCEYDQDNDKHLYFDAVECIKEIHDYWSEYDPWDMPSNAIISVTRHFRNRECRIQVNYNADCTVKSVKAYPRPEGIWNDEYEDLEQCFFDGLWFDFPTPFKKGDIVYNCMADNVSDNYDFCSGLFVLDDLITWYLRDDGAKRFNSFMEGTSGDTSDMTAYGYFMFEDGHIYHEGTYNYMDLEVYNGPFVGIQRMYKALSSYIRGDIELELFLYAHSMFILDKQKEDFTANCFTDEELKLAGLTEEEHAGD